MKATIRMLLGSALLVSFTSLSTAQQNKRYEVVSTHCPFVSPANSWRDYLAGNTQESERALFGVDFSVAVKNETTDRLSSSINPNYCYKGMFVPGRGYISWTTSDQATDLPGDPLRYEINVRGQILIYTPGGRVLDDRGQHVANLTCYWQTYAELGC